MYTDENYLWGLVGYYLGVLLLLVPTWWLTRPLPGFPLRALVRCAAVALLATPMLAYPDLKYLAPAWGVMLFDALSPAHSDGLLRGVVPLLAVFGLPRRKGGTTWGQSGERSGGAVTGPA